MQQPSERAVLSKADPAALWRLARYLGLERTECHCDPCLRRLVEWLARRMVQT